MRYVTAAGAIAVFAAGGFVVGCSSPHPAASPAACKSAYPAWFAASEAAGRTTATPAGCKGLSDSQITEISVQYLQGKAAQ